MLKPKLPGLNPLEARLNSDKDADTLTLASVSLNPLEARLNSDLLHPDFFIWEFES